MAIVKKDIKICKNIAGDMLERGDESKYNAISNVLKELNKKEEIINKAIEQIEYIRQYFSEDSQADFVLILEILKDKKVIDW